MDEIFSIKNTFIKKFGNKVYKYINQSKPTDIKFLKYYTMKNTNFFFHLIWKIIFYIKL